MRVVVGTTVVGLLVMVGGCTDSGGSPEPYAVVDVEGWSLQEAVDPPQDDALTSAQRPAMDWYSEHVRTVPVSGGAEGQMVRLSGHSASIDETRATLEELGWEFGTVTLEGWEGVGGTSADPSSPAVVLLDHGSTTFMLLSYELTVDELTAFAGSVEAVDETTWEATDGVIR